MRDRDLADHVHFELAAEGVDRDQLERAGHDNSRIVHQPRNSRVAHRLGNGLSGRRDRVGSGHVDQQRRQAGGSFRAKLFGGGRRAYAGEHAETAAIQLERTPGRCRSRPR